MMYKILNIPRSAFAVPLARKDIYISLNYSATNKLCDLPSDPGFPLLPFFDGILSKMMQKLTEEILQNVQ